MEPWRELLTDLAQKGEIQDLPAEQILDHIADLLYGIIFTDRVNGRRQQPEERHVQIMNILFHGLIK
jgi:peptide deformylase